MHSKTVAIDRAVIDLLIKQIFTNKHFCAETCFGHKRATDAKMVLK